MKRTEKTHDGQPITQAIKELRHERPNTLTGLAVCITGIVPGFKGHEAEDAAERHGARTTKNVSGKTDLLVIGHNAGRDKISRAQLYSTPAITAREFLAYI